MAPVRVDQWLPAFHAGDAIGDSALHIRNHLRSKGYESEIRALTVDQGLDARLFAGDADTADAVFMHFALPSPLTERLRRFQGRRGLIYHNITPPDFFAPYNPDLARMCAAGRLEIASLSRDVHMALADSEYNRLELEVMGFTETGELPIFLDLARYDTGQCGALARSLRDGRTNILFVGRVVPNKRIEHLIKTVFYYKKFISPAVRLIVAGRNTLLPAYSDALATLACHLHLSHEDVQFTGHVTHEELVTYYRNSHCFLSLSEHEGFCVPLVESMKMDLPIVALKRGAVPFTLDGAGLLLDDFDPAVTAEFVGEVCNDEALRGQILAGQRERLSYFETNRIERLFDGYLDRLLGVR